MSSLYDTIGKGYDTTRKADAEIVRRLRNNLQVANGSEILDVACGTGNYTIALQESGLKVTGSDVSKEMLIKAREKSSDIQWDLADVKKLPYNKNTFNGATCLLSIHHFDDLFSAFKEVFRVMDKGRFVIFTSSPEQMNNYWLKEYFPEVIDKSAKQMPEVKEVSNTLKQVGFNIIGHETFLIQPNLQDFFLYSGKYEPRMYLDDMVRSGISSFANLASKEEVEKGCSRLNKDIETNKIESVLNKYSSDLGDYVYVVAEKR